METITASPRIHQLDNQLANQIAAGEVVERPASVVKELLENAIDAKADRIDVEIERGGARMIRIIDNGVGIHKDDLPLALSRHATSKIQSFDDLCAVASMGFRGEALASIASVSRLLLRSRQAGENMGWQAQTHGRDMMVKLAPAAASLGTCVEVADLFFNTPARRKFLRTEKTEFAHIEDVVKRAALANPRVAVVLKHNGKVVRRFPAVQGDSVEKLKAACGSAFCRNALAFSGSLDRLTIHGWLGAPDYHRSESDTQFIFINQRPVKDRLLSHAIRQSYAGLLPTGRFASYVIYIECPTTEVDVNVHPTKHEVRFRQPRQVHDFLVKLLQQCLFPAQSVLTAVAQPAGADSAEAIVDRAGVIAEPLSSSQSFARTAPALKNYSQSHLNSARTSLPRPPAQPQPADSPTVVNAESLWQGRYRIRTDSSTLIIEDLWLGYVDWLVQQWQHQALVAKPLLIPVMVTVAEHDWLEEVAFFECFRALGFELSVAGEQQLMLRKLPAAAVALPASWWPIILQQLWRFAKGDFTPEKLLPVLRTSLRELDLQQPVDAFSELLNWPEVCPEAETILAPHRFRLSAEMLAKKLGSEWR
ncbi:MAG: DNA mismatch repair endonuclease MutL [Gammaproteobacteria bacterium]|nr:DNA mismatch repair endonuclease MutL [Gammaproteobacteria bacterium]